MKTTYELSTEIYDALYGTMVEMADDHLTNMQGTYVYSELEEVVASMSNHIKRHLATPYNEEELKPLYKSNTTTNR
tara:strand:- start:817 stop:1044 length:228 start_codon:yes stop_codon:yes gene_type:complete